MKRALIIRHSAAETLGGNFTALLEGQGFQLLALDVFASAPDYDRFLAPELSEVSLIIALGGPLSANDDFPALRRERAYLQAAVAQGTPVFAVCLGAQLLAVALGGVVEPTGGYQFGLRRLSVTAAGDADRVFGRISVPLAPTLHGDHFSLPDGAVKLAEGYMLCRDGGYRKINMAFRYGNSYGFQFEPQLTLDELRVWNRELLDDYKLMGEGFDPVEEAARNLREFAKYAPQHEAQMRELLRAFLENAGLVASAAAGAGLPLPDDPQSAGGAGRNPVAPGE